MKLQKVSQSVSSLNTIVTSSSGKEYRFNIHEKMNDLNIKSLIVTKQLEKGKKYDLDYDNQIIEHEKWDAKRTYKHTTGYFAGIGSIGNRIATLKIGTAMPTLRRHRGKRPQECSANCGITE
ncbi:MAG: hypothetical protein PWQ71_421 [Bacteroidota bacterium]|nr:hypothetical protein [Bacteroidota bacterium]